MSIELRIKCDACTEINEIDLEKLDPVDQPFPDDEDRSMGTHIVWFSKYEIECCNCGCLITINTNQIEYPLGNFQEVKVDVEGGSLM